MHIVGREGLTTTWQTASDSPVTCQAQPWPLAIARLALEGLGAKKQGRRVRPLLLQIFRNAADLGKKTLAQNGEHGDAVWCKVTVSPCTNAVFVFVLTR